VSVPQIFDYPLTIYLPASFELVRYILKSLSLIAYWLFSAKMVVYDNKKRHNI
jgi:hypothetical protein